MSRSIYILAQKSDWSERAQKIFDEVYYGPFPDSEEHERVNDIYADDLESDGFEVYSISMTDTEARKYYINSRDFWIAQVANLIRERSNA